MVIRSGRLCVRTAVLTALLFGLPPTAWAQSSIGFVGGGSIDPEQVYAGVFWQSPDIGGGFRLRPGLDGGFGSGLRLATINVDFMYQLPLGQGPWTLLTGGGPVIALTRFADDVFDRGTDVSAGVSYLFGFAHDSGFLTEFRVGGRAAPGLKFGAGWAVKLQ
jgi:hypothetical protein